MWVNPFWAGVVTTIVCEVIGLIIAVGITYHKDGKK